MSGIRQRIRRLASVDRMAQFAAVGTIGTTVDMTVLAVSYDIAGMSLVVSKLLSAELSFLVMFLINEYWTFAEFGRRSTWAQVRRLVRSNAVRLAGYAVAVGLLVVLTRATGMWYVLANLLAISVGFLVNYPMESLFTWEVHRSSAATD